MEDDYASHDSAATQLLDEDGNAALDLVDFAAEIRTENTGSTTMEMCTGDDEDTATSNVTKDDSPSTQIKQNTQVVPETQNTEFVPSYDLLEVVEDSQVHEIQKAVLDDETQRISADETQLLNEEQTTDFCPGATQPVENWEEIQQRTQLLQATQVANHQQILQGSENIPRQQVFPATENIQQEATQLLDQPTQIPLGMKNIQQHGTQILQGTQLSTQILQGTGNIQQGTQLLHQPTQQQVTQTENTQGTQLLDRPTQILQGTENMLQGTQLIPEATMILPVQETQIVLQDTHIATTHVSDMETDSQPATLKMETGADQAAPLQQRSSSSVRIASLRNSNLNAYKKCKAKLDANPDEPVLDSERLLLNWGDKRGGLKQASVVEEGNDVATSLAETPQRVTQPSNNVLAMWSNNRTSSDVETGRRSGKDELLEPDSSLAKVKKVLFGNPKDSDEQFRGQRQDIVVSTVLKDTDRCLSYLNSREPGEESQGYALDAVDRFLQLNCASQSQGDPYNGNANVPLALPGPVTTTPYKPQVLPQATSIQAEAAAVYAWVDSQGNEPDHEMPVVDEPEPKTGPATPAGTGKDVPRLRRPTGDKKPRRKSVPSTKTDHATTTTPKADGAATTTKPDDAMTSTKPDNPSTPTKPDDATAMPVTRSRRKRKVENNLQLVLAETPPSRRRRRQDTKVLFSRNIDRETLEEQKRIMKRFNMEVTQSAADCTHFVTAKFMRTTRMLEVMAVGKPVVTVQWLKGCEISGSVVDVKDYILEDSKKEKELGFCMRTTYNAAHRKLLFQDMTLYLTPNVKPPELRSIIQAAGGTVQDVFDSSNQDCVVVSCKEDKKLCTKIRKEGFEVYSSELLLGGILSYRLDYNKNILEA